MGLWLDLLITFGLQLYWDNWPFLKPPTLLFAISVCYNNGVNLSTQPRRPLEAGRGCVAAAAMVGVHHNAMELPHEGLV